LNVALADWAAEAGVAGITIVDAMKAVSVTAAVLIAVTGLKVIDPISP
jgi:hypothetical protein